MWCLFGVQCIGNNLKLSVKLIVLHITLFIALWVDWTRIESMSEDDGSGQRRHAIW